MKKISTAIVLFFFCTILDAQPKNVKGKVSAIDTAELSILHVSPADFPDVSVVFRAETKKGEPVWNLSKEKMRVTENGQSCEVISLQQLSAEKPISIGIVFDHSYSMSSSYQLLMLDEADGSTEETERKYDSPIDSAKKAVKNFARSFNTKKDIISVTGFSDSVDTRLPATRDINRINAVVDSMKPTASTALYNALITGIDEIKNTEGIKVLVALTDGQDNASQSTWKDVIQKANKENIPVYIIGLGEVAKEILQQVADGTKGQCYFTESSSSLDKIYADISKRIHAFYELGYRSVNFSAADTTRSIELRFDTDSLYLVTEASSAYFPKEVVETVARKSRIKEYSLYGGMAVIALAAAGLLIFRYSRNTNKEDKKKNQAPVIKTIFPNPSRGPVTIRIEGNATQLKFFTANGQLLGAYAIAGHEVQFDFSSSPRGAYLAVAYYGSVQSNTVQFILE